MPHGGAGRRYTEGASCSVTLAGFTCQRGAGNRTRYGVLNGGRSLAHPMYRVGPGDQGAALLLLPFSTWHSCPG